MNKQLSEKQVLELLAIPNFRHMTKEKVMQFATMLPTMEQKVAKKALEQFPEFTRIVLEALQDYKETTLSTLDLNDKSVQRCFNLYDEVTAALKICLSQPNLSFEEKKYYINKMMEIAQMAERKDSENKKFNWAVLGAGAAVVIAALGFGASLLGGNSHIQFPNTKS